MAEPKIPGFKRAELAGASRVSMSTVHKFLSGKGRLHPATQKALEDAARQIGLDVKAFREAQGETK